MKVVTVVGARPQFIKAAVVSHVLRRKHQEILVHTGQHFDYNMSEKFFEELDIPKPDYNLGISGGTHAEMTGRMMMAIERLCWLKSLIACWFMAIQILPWRQLLQQPSCIYLCAMWKQVPGHIAVPIQKN